VRPPLRTFVLVAVLLAACSGESAPQPPEAEATSSPSDPPFVNGSPCPASAHDELPEDAGCVSSVTGEGEQLLVYALLDPEDMPRRWRIRLSRDGEAVDQRLRAGNVTSYPRAVGVTDLNDDGDREWWVKTADYASHGAPWAGLSIFLATGDELARVTYKGEPLVVNFGGITKLGEGAVCRDGRLVVLRAWTLDRQNKHWRVSERTYELAGTRARFVGRTRRSFAVESYTDPDLVENYRVSCDGSTFTPFDS
jgi:hypothetical protein